jgi:hypothetical protein
MKKRVHDHDPNGVPIYLQICWDGATMFNFLKGKSFWPLCYSIMNLPPSLRNKVNIGLHVATMCNEAMASQKVFAEEMLDLWMDPIECNGVSYYCVVTQILMDGPGRQKYCRVRSTTSFDGCNICDFPAREFGQGRRVYDGFRRYLRRNHPRRSLKSKKNVIIDESNGEEIALQYSFDERKDAPKRR